MPGPVLPGSAWGAQLLCCVTLCLLWIVGAGVIQTPRHLIKGRTGKRVTLRCHQTDNYDYMYWYRHDLGHGPRLIYYSNGINSTEKGDLSNGYTVSRSNKMDFPLLLDSVTSSQTSVYFCADSYSTALHSCLLFIHKGIGLLLIVKSKT
uniref:Immunoglobulin V-set domain-containing protein n=1 Tax=Canis lupus familiaris TaxID=9615 RepID=A0A8C0MUW5_CANLF